MCILEFFTKDPGLTFFSTIIGIVASVLIAKNIFETEQNAKKEEDIQINNNEFELFKSSLREYLDPIDKQIEYLEHALDGSFTELGLSRRLSLDFLKIVDMNKIYLYKKETDLKELNELQIFLHELNRTTDTLRGIQENFQKERFHYFKVLESILRDIELIIQTNNKFLLDIDKSSFLNPNNIKKDFFDQLRVIREEYKNISIKELTIIDKHELILNKYIRPLKMICNINGEPIAKEIFIKCHDYEFNFKLKSTLNESHSHSLNESLSFLKLSKEKITLFIEKK